MDSRPHWFGIRHPLTPSRAAAAKVGAFVLPLLVWSVVSYVPFVWHPLIKVTDRGDSAFLQADMRLDRAAFETENATLRSQGRRQANGVAANPIFLPAPHEVGRAFYAAFTTPPLRKGDLWLHQSLWNSIQIIFWGFLASAVVGAPLGILCGTFDLFSKLIEPFVDFIRYMPAPAFGALMVAIFGIEDAPKVAIIFIGTFFQMVLVVANTTRTIDVGLLEAAQTLGATKKRLVTRVILPGILPALYTDMRVLLGWAWTYLIVAELIGAASGISYFINQQGKYRNYANVYAGIIMIGMIGLVCDQLLAIIGRQLFPWQQPTARGVGAGWMNFIFAMPRKTFVCVTSGGGPGGASRHRVVGGGLDVAATRTTEL
jgi:NitT/TauT family transport system permease protein